MLKFQDLTIGKKVGTGFGIIVFILMGVVLSTIQQVRTMEKITKRVVDLRTPTAHASLMMLNGINHSLASLRAWILLGDPKYKVGRAQAWTEQIEPSLAEMHRLAPNWTEPENQTRLRAIEKEMDAINNFQQKIEDIAQAPENSPARKILFSTAEPMEKKIVSTVSKMIAMEMNVQVSPERNKVIGTLAAIETTASLALERSEEFLMSGKQEFKNESLENWRKNKVQMEELKKIKSLLTEQQAALYETLETSIAKLSTSLEEIIRIRSGEEWNLANHWLETQAAPTASKIKAMLNEMTKIQEQLLENDVAEISDRTHLLITLLIALFFAAALISGLLGTKITHSISLPIKDISELASQLAQGKYKTKRLPSHADDELGVLCSSFNKLLDQLQDDKSTHIKK
jgi:methyl-accepting chemotaxis protein